MRRIIFLFALCLCGSVSSYAGAEEGEAAALAAFEEAKVLFTAGKYSEAADRFREANRLRFSWKLFFNIGQCEASAKRNGMALEAFEQYLSLGGDEVPSDRTELVLAEIRRLSPIVGFIAVEAPEGAVVSIDGAERGTLPLSGPLMVSAGVEQIVSITYQGQVILTRPVRVSGQQTISVSATAEAPSSPPADEATPLDGTAAPDDRNSAPVQATPAKKSPLKGVGIAAVSIGAVLLISGAVTGGLALSQQGKLEEQCPDRACPNTQDKSIKDRADALALATDVLIPAGAVVATVGIVLLIVNARKAKPEQRAAVTLLPVVGDTRGGLMIEGSF